MTFLDFLLDLRFMPVPSENRDEIKYWRKEAGTTEAFLNLMWAKRYPKRQKRSHSKLWPCTRIGMEPVIDIATKRKAK